MTALVSLSLAPMLGILLAFFILNKRASRDKTTKEAMFSVGNLLAAGFLHLSNNYARGSSDDIEISPGTTAKVRVTTEERRPIMLLLPFLNRFFEKS